ncbi:hypothetical protein [Streptomyces venezuelae]|uniref:hypothetical protein n=1 Tax=Streptomyces venezuelae TaxID=54571 RepID=UPI000D87EEFA|nr:hypothetical protein [Streptomyces venezuelae]
MQNYRVTWTMNGATKQSGVSYDLPSAEHRKIRLEAVAAASGIADIAIVEVKPGE